MDQSRPKITITESCLGSYCEPKYGIYLPDESGFGRVGDAGWGLVRKVSLATVA